MAGGQMLIAAVQIGGKSFQRAIWGWDWGSQGGTSFTRCGPFSRKSPPWGGNPRLMGGCGDGMTGATPPMPWGPPEVVNRSPLPAWDARGGGLGGGEVRGGQPRPSAPIGSKFGGAALIGPPGSHPPQNSPARCDPRPRPGPPPPPPPPGPPLPGARSPGAAMRALWALCLAGLAAALGSFSADQCSWRGR